MKIAQIAPLIESVPPRLYGGTERVVSYLTEALVAQGHDVTLFASADSLTEAELIPCAEKALRLNPAVKDIIPYYMIMLDRVREMEAEFDILHFHIDQFHFPLFRHMANRTVTTLHGRQDLADLKYLYEAFPEMPLVSISNAQRAPIPGCHFAATIHHGLPTTMLEPTYEPRGGYLAFLGRIAPEKGVDRAIAISRASGLPLKIAAKIDRVDRDYYDNHIKPLLNQSGVEFIGEIDDIGKGRFLGEASALLFPINWPEPFGLVMIEAMACGTPILAFADGSVPEVIDEGITGSIISSIDEAPRALRKVLTLDRRKVRQRFEERFSSARMARDYVAVYEKILARRRHPTAGLQQPMHATVASLTPPTHALGVPGSAAIAAPSAGSGAALTRAPPTD